MSFHIIIPARYASTRLPGKPLCDLNGHPMIQHVYDNACRSGAERVIIATDDERIEAAARRFGASVCMTATSHASGTDRVAEAARLSGLAAEAIIVNLQGDEPLLPPQLIRQVADLLSADAQASVATLCEPIQTLAALMNPNVVKVVRNNQQRALYFSRAPIPWLRDEFAAANRAFTPGQHDRHLGIYAYRQAFLQHLTTLPPAALEQAEALEQLRVLADGGIIAIARACADSGTGIDTPADLEAVRVLLAQKKKR